VASKGRFDRALSVKEREARGLPWRSTVGTDDFMALTLDLWPLPPESARRVGHPAPFPVELPEKLIELYTFADDLVLDPFMGSGSALVAAARLGRRYIGYDTDPAYVALARERVAAAGTAAASDGPAAGKLAEEALVSAGFTVTARDHRVPKSGVTVDFVAADAWGGEWLFDLPGPFTSHRGGLLRNDIVWRALGRASALRGRLAKAVPLVLLTTDLPARPGEGDTALRAAGPDVVFDVVDVRADEGRHRLALYGAGGCTDQPRPGFWTPADLERRPR
jgi:hypothetical protein